MKKLLLNTVLICCAITLSVISADAQCVSGFYPDGTPCNQPNTISTAVPFLRIVPDARSGAMGDAGIGLSPDANAMHYNISKLAFAEDKLGISVTYTPWLRALELQDVFLAYLSGYYKINDDQAAGLSLRYFSLGNINYTDEQGMPLGSGRPNEFELEAGYARKLSEKFSGALGLKFIYSQLATNQFVNSESIVPGTSVAGDISVTYKSLVGKEENTDLTIGMAISNIGTKISYTNSNNRDFIPTNLGLGSAAIFKLDDHNKITVAMDINKLLVPTPRPDSITAGDDTNDIPNYKEVGIFQGVFNSFNDAPGGFNEEMREFMISIGGEYWYNDQFALRAGYYWEHKTKGNRKFFTVGLGLKYTVFGLNFSYLVPTSNQNNPLNNTLRFSLLFDFDAFKSDNK